VRLTSDRWVRSGGRERRLGGRSGGVCVEHTPKAYAHTCQGSHFGRGTRWRRGGRCGWRAVAGIAESRHGGQGAGRQRQVAPALFGSRDRMAPSGARGGPSQSGVLHGALEPVHAEAMKGDRIGRSIHAPRADMAPFPAEIGVHDRRAMSPGRCRAMAAEPATSSPGETDGRCLAARVTVVFAGARQWRGD
jgi:hypothetical protein